MIVRQRPTAAGLDDNFTIVDDRESGELLASAIDAWIRRHPDAPDAFLGPEFAQKGYYRTQKWSEILLETARSFIGQAKDDLLTPAALRRRWSSARAHCHWRRSAPRFMRIMIARWPIAARSIPGSHPSGADDSAK